MTLALRTDLPQKSRPPGDETLTPEGMPGSQEEVQGLAEQVTAQRRTLRRQAAEFEAVAGLSASLRGAATAEEVLEILLDVAIHTLAADGGAGLLLEEDGLVVAALVGVPGARQARHPLPGEDPLWPALEAGRPFFFDPDLQRGSVAGHVCRILALDMPAVAIVPLQVARQTVALLALAFATLETFQELERPLVAMAEIAGSALQRIQTVNALEWTIRDRMRDLAALYEATAMTTLHLDTPIILERMLDKALEVVGGDAGIIHLLAQEEPEELAIACAIPSWLIDWLQVHDLGPVLWGRVLERERPLIVNDWPALLPAVDSSFLERFPAYVGEPISAAGHIVGVLSVFGEAVQAFSAEDIALLTAIANHVGAVIESARLRHRAEEAAVMEERQRLAREMHDSVTQSLYSLNLFAEAAQDSICGGDLERTHHYLERLSATGQQALKEMRLLIYQLHPPALSEEGLAGALRQRLEAVEHRAGVQAQIVVDAPLVLPSRVESALYRIAQEALNNVLKHAHACRVVVRIGSQGEQVYLEVEDNGRGFDLDRVEGHGGLGLMSIRERAEELGGEVRVSSAPGTGTAVRVVVPLPTASGAQDLEAGL
jgi:signal transduction histidine kinase